jgi:hypothetical protein
MDSKQPDMEQRVVIKVIKPWPFWAKATAAALPSLMLIGYAAFLILHRRRKALRLHVYYWAEQASICQTVVLTKEAEVVDLSPAAPLRLKREGRTQNLIVQPIEGSTLFAASGQEASMLSVGDGLRVTARDARGLTRALAISIRQKPCRPSPAADESETLANAAVCGLLKSTDSAQAPAESEEFNWGLDTASTKGE